MAPTPDRPDYIFSGPDRTETVKHQPEIKKVSSQTDPKILRYGKYFVLRSKKSNQVSNYNKHVNMPFNKVITSNNVLIKGSNHSTSSVWEWKASLSPKSQEKMSHTPVKKIPRPGPTRNKIPRPGKTRNKIPRPDPTRPENILQNVPRPRTGFGPVRSGPVRGNSGFRVAPQFFMTRWQSQTFSDSTWRSRTIHAWYK